MKSTSSTKRSQFPSVWQKAHMATCDCTPQVLVTHFHALTSVLARSPPSDTHSSLYNSRLPCLCCSLRNKPRYAPTPRLSCCSLTMSSPAVHTSLALAKSSLLLSLLWTLLDVSGCSFSLSLSHLPTLWSGHVGSFSTVPSRIQF